MQLFQIINHKSSIINHKSGFTLVEMLASIVVFIIIGTIVVAILTTSFRTSHKTDEVTVIQQNGNYALSQMAKTIRNARGLISPFPCTAVSPTPVTTLSILTPDDQEVNYVCTSSTIASNGASLLDTTAVALSSCSFTCSQQSRSDLPFIQINFSLKQISNSTFAEQLASLSAVPFQTSVVIRNINR